MYNARFQVSHYHLLLLSHHHFAFGRAIFLHFLKIKGHFFNETA